jgi:putative transposase
VILGFAETSCENHRVIVQLFQDLKRRGLRVNNEILFIIDGSKGIHKAIELEFSTTAYIQRCQWHKREDVMSYLTEEQRIQYRPVLQQAYEKKTYDQAKEALKKMRLELSKINLSAVRSLDEGLEEQQPTSSMDGYGFSHG